MPYENDNWISIILISKANVFYLGRNGVLTVGRGLEFPQLRNTMHTQHTIIRDDFIVSLRYYVVRINFLCFRSAKATANIWKTMSLGFESSGYTTTCFSNQCTALMVWVYPYFFLCLQTTFLISIKLQPDALYLRQFKQLEEENRRLKGKLLILEQRLSVDSLDEANQIFGHNNKRWGR